MKSRMIVIFTLLFLGALPAFAAEENKMEQKAFEMLDTNHDGKISHEEAMANKNLNDTWSKYDNNKDGQLERAEFSRFEEEMAGAKGMNK